MNKAEISLCLPKNNSTVSQLTAGQKKFFALPPDERKLLFADQKERLQLRDISFLPRSIKFSWINYFTLTSDFTIRVSNDKDFSEFLEIKTSFPFCELYNLELAKEYFWQVSAESAEGTVKSAINRFFTADESPRLLYVNEIENLRDIGPKKSCFGKTIRQNMIFRSTILEDITKIIYHRNSEKLSFLDKTSLSELSKNYLTKYLGIKTELDLRAKQENLKDLQSPLGPEVNYLCKPCKAYAIFLSEAEKGAFREIFKVFLNEANYPIIFHCHAGQDRTGCVAFILAALLGVSENDLRLDWEASALWNVHIVFRHEFSFDKLIEEFEKIQGNNYTEKAETYIKSLGFTQKDIDKFRKIMLE